MSKRIQVFLYAGNYGTFKHGQNAPGLDLNRLIRDELRHCGYPCLSCDEVCVEPDLCETIASCLSGGGLTFTDLPTDYGITLADIATSGSFNDLADLPSFITDILGLSPSAGDMLQFDGTNWVLGTGSSGGTFIGLSDTLGAPGPDDNVLTFDASGNVVSEPDNRLHTEAGSYATVGAGSFLDGNVTGFTFSTSSITVTGNKATGTHAGSIDLNPGGAFPAQVILELSLDNTGKKYPLSNPVWNTHIFVNGQMVNPVIVGGTSTTIQYGIDVTATDIVTFNGSVIGDV